MQTVLTNSNIVAFVIMNDAEKAKAFYGQTLGLPLVADEMPFALVFDANGIHIRVGIMKEVTPAKHTVLGWCVDDIAAAVKDLQAAGVVFERYDFPHMKQDELGVWTAPNGAKVAWFLDPAGNVLSIGQQPGASRK